VAQRRGNNFAEARRELFRRIMRKAREENMFEARGLFGDGRSNGRMRVAVNVYPPGRNRIQNSPAILQLEEYPFATANLKRWRVRAFVSERMPEVHILFSHVLLKRGLVKSRCEHIE
jgi:hypothetical protein